jgi:hypothetical protein
VEDAAVIATNEDGSPVRPMKLREIHFDPDPNAPLGTLLGRTYTGPNRLRVIANREHGEWHISVSHPDRYPSWDELRDVAWALHPERQFKVIVPPVGQPYTNAHYFCLHLYEDREA